MLASLHSHVVHAHNVVRHLTRYNRQLYVCRGFFRKPMVTLSALYTFDGGVALAWTVLFVKMPDES